MNIKAGKVEIAGDAFIGKVAVDKDATTGNGASASDVAVVNNGTIFAAEVIEYNEENYAHETSTAESAIIDQVSEETISSGNKIQVGTAEALMNLAFAQSTGLITGNAGVFDIELKSDINLTGRTWVPFGAEYEDGTIPFAGTIDGKTHKIIGLSNGSYLGKITSNKTTSVAGDIYGFIAKVTGNVTVQNITFDKVNINAVNSKECGVVIGDTGDEDPTNSGQPANTNNKGKSINTDSPAYLRSIVLKNINVNGRVTAKDKIGGLIGYLYNQLPQISIENCHVSANLTLTGDGTRANGLIGMVSNSFVFATNMDKNYNCETHIKDCSYNGVISVGTTTGTKARISAISFINKRESYTSPEGYEKNGSMVYLRTGLYVENFTIGNDFNLIFGESNKVCYYTIGKAKQVSFDLGTALICADS